MYQPQGSLQSAAEGHYDLPLKPLLKEAWYATDGSKLLFFFAYVIIILIALAMNYLGEMAINHFIPASPYPSENDGFAIRFVVEVFFAVIQTPLYAALFLMSIRKVNGAPVRLENLFDGYKKFFPLAGAYLIMYFFITIGFLLLILPGIYLSIAYAFAYPLMLEKNMSIWEALETSRKAVGKQWFRVFGVMLAMALITVASIIPLGIGLFWTIPMLYLLLGMMYTRIFGFDGYPDMPDGTDTREIDITLRSEP